MHYSLQVVSHSAFFLNIVTNSGSNEICLLVRGDGTEKNLAILQGHYMPDYCIPFEIIFHPAPGGNLQSERLNVYFFNFCFETTYTIVLLHKLQYYNRTK